MRGINPVVTDSVAVPLSKTGDALLQAAAKRARAMGG